MAHGPRSGMIEPCRPDRARIPDGRRGAATRQPARPDRQTRAIAGATQWRRRWKRTVLRHAHASSKEVADVVIELMTVEFETRHRELVAEGERARLLAAAEATATAPRPAPAALRGAVGSALVRAGKRIR